MYDSHTISDSIRMQIKNSSLPTVLKDIDKSTNAKCTWTQVLKNFAESYLTQLQVENSPEK